jgi:hypothetical protein
MDYSAFLSATCSLDDVENTYTKLLNDFGKQHPGTTITAIQHQTAAWGVPAYQRVLLTLLIEFE